MKLIDILVQELPKRGGWPEGATSLCQGYDGQIEKLEGENSFGTDIFMELLIKEHREWAHTANECNAEIVTREQYEAALKQSVWDGTDAPPVGVECEMADENGMYKPVKIIAIENGCVIGWDDERMITYISNKTVDFRPTRTKAEKMRNEAETKLRTCLIGTGAGITPRAAKYIYDAIAAGEIPGVKLEKE